MTTKLGSVDEVSQVILRRARALFQMLEYEEALVAFTQCIALTEGGEGTPDSDYLEWRGALVHNIASCHHHLGHFDVAQAPLRALARPKVHKQLHDMRAYTLISLALVGLL